MFEPKNRIGQFQKVGVPNVFWRDEFPALTPNLLMKDGPIRTERYGDWKKISEISGIGLGTPVSAIVHLPKKERVTGKIECFIPKQRGELTLEFLVEIRLDKPIRHDGVNAFTVYLPLDCVTILAK